MRRTASDVRSGLNASIQNAYLEDEHGNWLSWLEIPRYDFSKNGKDITVEVRHCEHNTDWYDIKYSHTKRDEHGLISH